MDVSDNDITGFLPSDLRWTDLTKLDISGNRLRGVVPPLLCLLEDLNGNGNYDVYHCDRLACPSGHYNSKGRYFGSGNEEKCLPCYDGTPFIGQKQCKHKNNPHSVFGQIMDGSTVVIESAKGYSTKLVFAIIFLSGSILFCCCVLRQRRQRYQKEMNNVEQRAILNHTKCTSLRKYQDDSSSIGSSKSNSSGSDGSSGIDQQLEMHIRDECGFNDQYKDSAESFQSPKSDGGMHGKLNDYPSNGSVSSSHSAPLATDFLRNQRGSINKKSPIKKVTQDHVPRVRDTIRKSIETVSNGVRNQRRRNPQNVYDAMDADQYSTVDFGLNVDLEIMGNDDTSGSGSTDSSDNRSKGSGGPRQYSDLLDVPTLE